MRSSGSAKPGHDASTSTLAGSGVRADRRSTPRPPVRSSAEDAGGFGEHPRVAAEGEAGRGKRLVPGRNDVVRAGTARPHDDARRGGRDWRCRRRLRGLGAESLNQSDDRHQRRCPYRYRSIAWPGCPRLATRPGAARLLYRGPPTPAQAIRRLAADHCPDRHASGRRSTRTVSTSSRPIHIARVSARG